MKEKILEAFSTLGFKLDEVEGLGYNFSYEGLNFLWTFNEDDEDFLNISIPAVYDYEDNKLAQSCALMFKVNSTLKYVKAYNVGTNIWLFYERELFGGEDLEKLISRMILHLEAALAFTRKAIEDIEKVANDDDDEDTETEECCAEEIIYDKEDKNEEKKED